MNVDYPVNKDTTHSWKHLQGYQLITCEESNKRTEVTTEKKEYEDADQVKIAYAHWIRSTSSLAASKTRRVNLHRHAR